MMKKSFINKKNIMNKRIYLPLLICFTVLHTSCGQDLVEPVDNTSTVTPPGVVVNHSKKETRIYLGSPSICILPNGDYLISHDESGPGSVGYPNTTRIYKSSDKGQTWTRISSIADGQTWSNIFEYDGAVYIMGTKGPILPCLIRKSTDNGVTWTAATDSNNGLLMSWNCHTSSVPMVIQNGRIWRGMEVKNPNLNGWPKQYNAMIMSAPIGADLMKASSWTKSNQLEYNNTYLDGDFGGWLEGNAVIDKNGGIKLIMRVEVPGSTDEVIAIIDVRSDGKVINFNPANGFVKMPGGAKKFTIRYDSTTNKYLTLSNYVDPSLKYMTPGFVRNKLALCSSNDLINWKVDKIILEHDDVKYHGFQYVDWLIEGNDIIFVSRTAYDDAFGGADTYHNSNYITFHRITDYKSSIKNVTSSPNEVNQSNYAMQVNGDMLRISSLNNQPIDSVKISDARGVTVYSSSPSEKELILSLPRGIYIVNVNHDFTKKISVN